MPSAAPVLRLIASASSDESGAHPPAGGSSPNEQDDLSYRVEMWNVGRTTVERVLSISSTAQIGLGAFYAATSEFPDRYITLRYGERIVNSWGSATH